MKRLFLILIPVMMCAGCKTEWHENGQMKSYGFHLGTQGLGEYYLIKFDAKARDNKE